MALSGVALADPATTVFRIPGDGVEFSAPAEFFPTGELRDLANAHVKSAESAKGGLVLTYEVRLDSTDPTTALEAEFVRRRGLPLDGDIAYERLKKGEWFILSGTDGSSVYYTKAIALENGIAILDATYSAKRKELLDLVVADIARSFARIGTASTHPPAESAPGGKAQQAPKTLPEILPTAPVNSPGG